jgi:hypothetical protein
MGKFLRKIFRPVLEDGFWTTRRNSENYKLYDECDDVKFIKLGTLWWAGHVMRKEESDSAKKVICTKPGESAERRGRPKLRRCGKLEEEVVLVGCRNWRINAQ